MLLEQRFVNLCGQCGSLLPRELPHRREILYR
jgi:hypothetical protein